MVTDKMKENHDDEINVEEIMAKIRERIRRHQAAGELSANPDTRIAPDQSARTGLTIDDSLQRDLAYLNTYREIQNNSYFISSHRPYIGKIIVKGRTLVHGEIRRYVDPIIDKQSGFNKSTVQVLNSLVQKVEKIDETTSNAIKDRNTALSQLESKLENSFREETLRAISVINSDIEQKIRLDFQNALSTINIDIEQKIRLDVQNALSAINTDIKRKTELAHILEERIHSAVIKETIGADSSGLTGINYLSFENQFRGSQEDISERQKKFIPYFTSCNNVLDVGCGRGEFLELMREQGIGVRGVDSDKSMVEFCRTKGLEVEMSDAVSYLEHLKDQSLEGIFIDQVVEHLEPAYLVTLLGFCYRKMKDGHCIVIETVNPLSFASLANFYIDMTHKHPVHPETLKYLMKLSGFNDIEVQFSSPIPEQARLQYIPDKGSDNSEMRESLVSYNRNIDILNSVLFGPQDYIVIGKK